MNPTIELIKYDDSNEIATVKIGEKSRRIKAIDYPDRIELYELAVKFRNSDRIHKGVATYWKKGKSYKFKSTETNKDNALLVGFYYQL